MAYNSLDDISKILEKYANDVQGYLDESADNVSKEGVNKLKKEQGTYKIRTGKYNKGWRVKKNNGDRYVSRIIHNATDYQLTHLLENGHITRNGTSRTRAFKHIAPVHDYCVEQFQNEVENAIKKG